MSKSGPVVAILLRLPEREARMATNSLNHIRRLHPDRSLILLTTPEIAEHPEISADTVWRDGLARGPGHLLALLRRLSWLGASQVYDLSPCFMSRLIRILVLPRPKWEVWSNSGAKSRFS